MAELAKQMGGNPIDELDWQQSINDAFRTVNSLNASDFEKHQLRAVLTQAKRRPYNKINRHKVLDFIENIAVSTEFGGHQNRLSHYFRNLYSAFIFINEQSLSRGEKYSLSKVLRAKLSNYEQALLAINSLSNHGSEWISSRIMGRYMPIKNIPEHFFSFDNHFKLKDFFPQVVFEFEKNSWRVRLKAWVARRIKRL